MVDLIKVLDEAVAQHELAYWQQKLEEHDIPHAILPDYEQIGNDEQMAANDVFVDVDGYPNVRTVNTPIEIAGIEKRRPGSYPELGQHTGEILQEIGYTEEEIDTLAASNIVQQS
jgi:formyl-CoA transferase